MSTNLDLAGNDIPDIDNLANTEEAVKNNPVTINTSAPVDIGFSAITDKEEMLKRLVNPQNPIKILSGQTETVTSMGDVADQLAAKKVISFHDAEEVNLVFENFKDHFSFSEFTAAPSKTNLRQVQQYVRQEHRVRMEGLKADFQTFVLEPFAELDQLLSSLNEKLGPSTQELVKNFATECTEWLKLQNSVANQEFVVGLDTVNAATMPLWEIPAQIETTRGSAQSFLKAVQNLRDATCAETFQEFFTYRSADIAEGKLSFDRISLLDMLKMMAENATSWLQIQQVEAARSLKELHEAIDGFKGDPSEFTIVRDFLVNNQEKTAETVAWVKDTVNSHHLAILMAMNLSTVLRFFKLG
jgi:hypothetical protein